MADEYWEIALFTRAPLRGRVKTRLAAELGEQGALLAHQRLVEHALTALSGLQALVAPAKLRASLWLAGSIEFGRPWADRMGAQLHAQCGDDLGARMGNCLAACVAAGAGRVCLMGTDCPPIDAAYLARAFAGLDAADVVLGPAEDGGYGLIGIRADAVDATDQLFAGIPWSTDAVARCTRQAVSDAGLRLVELPMIWDVDTPESWRRFLQWQASR